MSRRPLPEQYGEGRTLEMELTDWGGRLDRVVTIDDDVLVIIASWGPCSGCAADVEGNGVVAVDDLLAVVAGWGLCS